MTSTSSTKLELSVSGARKGTPFWLVLGESDNAGWEATVAGKDVGGSTLVDGYANGWKVHPTSGNFDVTLRWTPQRNVWIALGISAVALLVCLFLALRRRRRGGDGDEDSDAEVDVDAVPALANPLAAAGHRPSPVGIVVGALAVGVIGAVLAAWWVGLAAAVLVAVVAWFPRWRFLVSIGAPVVLGACALYVIVQQYRHDYPSDLDWPGYFTRVNNLAWLAVILLLADVVVERLRGTGRANEPLALDRAVHPVDPRRRGRARRRVRRRPPHALVPRTRTRRRRRRP